MKSSFVQGWTGLFGAMVGAAFLLPASPAGAGTSAWTGPGSDFSDGANWSAGVPGDDAAFNAAGPSSLSLTGPVSLNTLTFNPGAPAYTVDVSRSGGQAGVLNVNGAGIRNNSSSAQTLHNGSGGSTSFNNASSASGASIINDVDGSTSFHGTSTAGDASIANLGAQIGGGSLSFHDGSTAGSAAISNLGFSRTDFLDASSAGRAVIDNEGSTSRTAAVSFQGTATAGNARITNGGVADGGMGALSFEGSSTAGGAVITNNNAGQTVFSGSSRAGQAMILNNTSSSVGGTFYSGSTVFREGASADHGTITNSGNGSTSFQDQSTAGDALIISNDAGRTAFSGNATGGNATLVTGGGGTVDISGLATPGMTAGAIQGSGAFILGSKTFTVGSNGADMDVSGVLSGAGGSLVKTGPGTLTLSGANTFTGVSRVDAGGLSVTGSLAGGVQVGAQGRLTGGGAVGGVVNDGIVSPGNQGLGALTAASYAGGGVLSVDFSGAAHTSLQVSGNADISRTTLNVNGSDFSTGQYSVVHAGSLAGPFAAVNTPPSAFLTFTESYTPTDALLDIAPNGASFSSVAQTPNQGGVASALDGEASGGGASAGGTPGSAGGPSGGASSSLNDGGGTSAAGGGPSGPPPSQGRSSGTGDVVRALQFLSAEQARAAYTQMSGVSLTSFQAAGLRGAALFASQMNARVHPPSQPSAAAPVQAAYNGDVMERGGLPGPARAGGPWVRGIGLLDRSKPDASLGSPGVRAGIGGIQAGYDHRVGSSLLVGLSGGYAQTGLRMDGQADAGASDARQGGVYAGWAPSAFFLTGSLSYVDASNDMRRAIIFPGVDRTARASFKSRMYTAFAESGWAFKPSGRLALEPSLSLEETRLEQQAFTESGAPGLNLAVEGRRRDAAASSLGVRAARRFGGGSSHPLALGVRPAWRHQWSGADNRITARFADAPGAAFIAQGTPLPRDAAGLDVDGRLVLFGGFQAFLNYSALFSPHEGLHGLSAGLTMAW